MANVHPKTEVYCIVGGVKVANNGKDKSRVLTMRRKSLLFSCSGFTVFNEEGNLVFRVDNYDSGRAGEVVLMDVNGKSAHHSMKGKLSLDENWTRYDGEDAVDPVYSVKKRYARHLHIKSALARVAA
ncbi:protein LURP-one-related 8-like [Zingiber officinale]|uniref:protein LURP-one-related 8-like n=1 Tax=Zingiber officinale TaxID=94328 RepID=UPI001C4C699B|nr:protein LURP-one-related 8-like [Zingiber officinale]